jgi:hypothetical protein
MVSLLSTSSVTVFPVRVFTKICISPEFGDYSPEEWGFGGEWEEWGGVGRRRCLSVTPRTWCGFIAKARTGGDLLDAAATKPPWLGILSYSW